MKQTSHPTVQPRTAAPKAAAIAGIVFSVLLIFSLGIILMSVPSNIQDGGAWLATRGNRFLLALDLIPFSGIAFLWFMAVVRDRLGKSEDQFFATVFLGSGLLFLAMLFVFAAITGSIILLYVTHSTRLLAAGFYDFGRTVAHEILNTYMVKIGGVFIVSTCTLFVRTKVIPRWIALLGYGAAALMLLRIHHLDRLSWISLLFPLWILLVSFYILVDNYRQKSVTQVSS